MNDDITAVYASGDVLAATPTASAWELTLSAFHDAPNAAAEEAALIRLNELAGSDYEKGGSVARLEYDHYRRYPARPRVELVDYRD